MLGYGVDFIPDEHRHGGEFRAGSSRNLEIGVAAADFGMSLIVDVYSDFSVGESADYLEDLYGIYDEHTFFVDFALYTCTKSFIEVEGGDSAKVVAVGIVVAVLRVRRALEKEAVDGGEGIFCLRNSRRRNKRGKELLLIEGNFHMRNPFIFITKFF